MTRRLVEASLIKLLPDFNLNSGFSPADNLLASHILRRPLFALFACPDLPSLPHSYPHMSRLSLFSILCSLLLLPLQIGPRRIPKLLSHILKKSVYVSSLARIKPLHDVGLSQSNFFYFAFFISSLDLLALFRHTLSLV